MTIVLPLVTLLLMFLTYGFLFATLTAFFPKLNQKTVLGISVILALVVSPIAIIIWGFVAVVLDGRGIPYPWENGFQIRPKVVVE